MNDIFRIRQRIHRAIAVLPLSALACGPSGGHVDYPEETGGGCAPTNWCGSIESAQAIASEGDQAQGCPATVQPTDAVVASDPAGYEAIGSLRETMTRMADATAADACCYTHVYACPGRPLREGARWVVAEERRAEGWLTDCEWRAADLEQILALDVESRAAFAAAWRRDGLLEHASVASFSRAALELLALAAPADLVAQYQRAGLEEIRHAQMCFAIAYRYDPVPTAPGPLAAPPARESSFVRLAIDTFVEGCVHETTAALEATRAGAGCTVAAVSRVLHRIAEDETEHAATAWATIAWALEQGGQLVALALRREADRVGQQLASSISIDDDNVLMRQHGRVTETARQATRREAYRELIAPSINSLLKPWESTAARSHDAPLLIDQS